MRLQLKWGPLIPLRDGTPENMIFRIDHLDKLPNTPGVYVFGRKLGGHTFVPTYIGQAQRLRGRIIRQFNNARLMLGLKSTPGRRRFLAVGQITSKPGLSMKSALNVAERILIEHALAEGHEILNVQGTKRPTHTLSSWGAREAKQWLPRRLSAEKRR